MQATTGGRLSRSIPAISPSIPIPNELGEGHQLNEPVSRHGPFHAAVGTPLSIEEVGEKLAAAMPVTPSCAIVAHSA